MIVKALYYMGSFCLSIMMVLNPVFSYEKLVILCCFPLTQYTAFGTLIVKAVNTGTVLSFNNFTDPFIAGFSMADAFIYTTLMTIIMLLIFIYMIPLSIAIDEENPLRWYYPCVCGCLRKRRNPINFVEDENDNEIE